MFIKVAGGKTSFSYSLVIYRLLSVRIPKPIEPVGILITGERSRDYTQKDRT